MKVIFNELDKDKSGYASIDEMCDYFDQQKQLKLTNENKNDFKKSMVPIYES